MPREPNIGDERPGQTTTMAYDKLDRLTSTTDANGDVTTSAFDAVGNIDLDHGCHRENNHLAYDSMHRVTVVTNPDGAVATTVYDMAGKWPTPSTTGATRRRPCTTRRAMKPLSIDGAGNITTMAYDADNQLTVTINPLGLKRRSRLNALERTVSTDRSDGGRDDQPVRYVTTRMCGTIEPDVRGEHSAVQRHWAVDRQREPAGTEEQRRL